MITLTREDAGDYSDIITFTPYWTDACQHEGDAYVCSFRIVLGLDPETKRRVEVNNKYDLYLFHNSRGLELCIRYGNEGGDYISPGEVTEFLLRPENASTYNNTRTFIAQDEYAFVTILLRKYGQLSFNWKQTNLLESTIH